MIYDENKYKSKLVYPVKTDFAVFHIYSKGKVVANGLSSKELKEWYANHVPAAWIESIFSIKKKLKELGIFVEEEECIEAFKAAKIEYFNDEKRLTGLYKAELYAYYGTCFSDETLDLLYAQAWSDNHSDGYEAAENRFDELVDFATSIINSEDKRCYQDNKHKGE
jgi:hypothetical protein